MSSVEAERYRLSKKTADYYARAVQDHQDRLDWIANVPDYVRAEDQPWEMSRQGKLKHLVNEHMQTRIASMDVYIQEIPPGSRSGRHRHFAEEFVHVIEGRGYDMHWDSEPGVDENGYAWAIPPEDQGVKWEWEQGDSIFIPPMVVHQHFNADPEKPARIICTMSRVYKTVGYGGIEQLEDAPEYEAGG
jgi:quercetin dioxygenase-like cupin family protein